MSKMLSIAVLLLRLYNATSQQGAVSVLAFAVFVRRFPGLVVITFFTVGQLVNSQEQTSSQTK